MVGSDARRMAVNRQKWDESVPLHVRSALYDVPAFLRGRGSLRPMEVEALGTVSGRDLLHVQCHFGMDTLSWARLGATVTGLDYSPAAVRAARSLARRARLAGTFVEGNATALPRSFDGSFDIVCTGKGAICWLPRLDGWARGIARALRPGGRFYLLDDHPVAETFDNDVEAVPTRPKIDYFGGNPLRGVYDGTYATGHRMRHRVSYTWIHPVAEILGCLLDAGLQLSRVQEYPFSYWHKFEAMKRGRDGYYRLPATSPSIPMLLSVLATKPSGASGPDGIPAARAGGS